jgi:hypothetical protein
MVNFTLRLLYPPPPPGERVGWVVPRAGLDAVTKRKNSCPYRESKLSRPASNSDIVLTGLLWLPLTLSIRNMCSAYTFLKHVTQYLFKVNKQVFKLHDFLTTMLRLSGRGVPYLYWFFHVAWYISIPSNVMWAFDWFPGLLYTNYVITFLQNLSPDLASATNHTCPNNTHCFLYSCWEINRYY